tara:strand:+ start:1516 stop:1983 length:468 start_codon:yes stop_codon:yes gene_type:complete
MRQKKYNVIKDTREQKGWDFSDSASCSGTTIGKLDTGDYSLEGYEEILSIERKGSISEFARNITEKRFERELERMVEYKYRYVILEFNMRDIMDYPHGSGIPYSKRKYIKIKGPFILKRTLELGMKYNVHILFCGAYGKEVASSIFKRVVELESR